MYVIVVCACEFARVRTCVRVRLGACAGARALVVACCSLIMRVACNAVHACMGDRACANVFWCAEHACKHMRMRLCVLMHAIP